MNDAAFLATFVSLKTMADGQVRIVLDAQCTLSEISALGLMPGVAFGIARIKGEATIPKVEDGRPADFPPYDPNKKMDKHEWDEMVRKGTEAWRDVPDSFVDDLRGNAPDKPKGGALAKLCGMWCNDPVFLDWYRSIIPCDEGDISITPEFVASSIRADCGIESRAELDSNEEAAAAFNDQYRHPFMAWKEANNK